MVVKSAVLKTLETNFAESGNQLYVLYGRADSEKELLIRTFLKDKKSFYYRCRNASPLQQLNIMSSEVANQFDAKLREKTFAECFNRIKSGGPAKMVVVIDEFDLVARKDESFMEAILLLKQKKLYPGPVMILLCTSAVAWMDREFDEMLGKKNSSLLDGKIKLSNLNFLEVVRALPEYPVSECIKVYGIIGGVPGYINRWNAKADIKTNICRMILSRSGYMYDKAEGLLAESLRELSVYDTILANIAAGNDKLNDLFHETGFSRAKISVYMKNLAAFDIITKVISFETGGWDNAKKGIYRIKDNYVNFWFHFIYPHLSELNMMGVEEFYDAFIAPGLDEYVERYFKEVCMEYLGLLGLVGRLPMTIKKMGTWVGKDGNIDIIAQNEVRENMVGLCNWEQKELTMEMVDSLLESMKLAKISAKQYYLFSAKGFAEDVVALSEEKKEFVLVDMNEL